jgi:hypothetical protein
MNEENDSSFSLNDLRVPEEQIGAPIIFPVSVIVSVIQYGEQSTDLVSLRDNIQKRLEEKYGFRKGERRRFKEGFLQFSCSGDIIECVYARESPAKIEYERDDLKIHTDRLRLISPALSARIKLSVGQKEARVVIFGGLDTLISKALGLTNMCIVGCVRGGHKIFPCGFSQEEMEECLRKFGSDVQFVWIDPGESEKLIRFIEKKEKGGTRRVLDFMVHTKLEGYRITASPFVLDLMKEVGIHIREIQGRLRFLSAFPITAKISADGRILFFIPETMLGKDDSAYGLAERLYEKVITKRSGAQQKTLGEY